MSPVHPYRVINSPSSTSICFTSRIDGYWWCEIGFERRRSLCSSSEVAPVSLCLRTEEKSSSQDVSAVFCLQTTVFWLYSLGFESQELSATRQRWLIDSFFFFENGKSLQLRIRFHGLLPSHCSLLVVLLSSRFTCRNNLWMLQ